MPIVSAKIGRKKGLPNSLSGSIPSCTYFVFNGFNNGCWLKSIPVTEYAVAPRVVKERRTSGTKDCVARGTFVAFYSCLPF